MSSSFSTPTSPPRNSASSIAPSSWYTHSRSTSTPATSFRHSAQDFSSNRSSTDYQTDGSHIPMLQSSRPPLRSSALSTNTSGYSQRAGSTTSYHLYHNFYNQPTQARGENGSSGFYTPLEGSTPTLVGSQSRLPTSSELDKLREVESNGDVRLGPWEHHWLPLIGLMIAVTLQASLFGGSLYIWRYPIERPLGRYLFGKVTVKYYNFAVSVAGAVINGAAVFGLAVGARSYISRLLLGRGITLHGYDSLWAIGNGGIARRISRYAIIPIILYFLTNLSASAVNAVWVVGNEQVTTSFNLSYVDVSSNQGYYTSPSVTSTQIFEPEDFESLAFAMADALNEGKNSTAANTVVDGLNMTISNGVVPSLKPINHFRQSIKHNSSDAGGQSVQLPPGRAEIISFATTNDYALQAPTTVASSTCVSHWGTDPHRELSTLTLTWQKGNDSSFYYLHAVDTRCPDNNATFAFSTEHEIIASSWGCIVNNEVYTSYFALNPRKNSTAVLASCYSTVATGIANLTYGDLTSSYSISDSPELEREVDVTAAAWAMYLTWFAGPSHHNAGSPGLSFLVRANLFNLNQFTYGEPWANIFQSWSQATLAMGMTKLMNTNTIFDLGPASEWTTQVQGSFLNYTSPDGSALPMVVNHLSVQAKSDALVVGPSGYTAALLIVIGVMFVLLCGALGVALAAPPVALNPLDPVSVLLIAQNSPPSARADGGCLGNVSQVRDQKVPIQYRAVNSQHLAFIFGENNYATPLFGRMYG
ncbi:hypothetical protein T439DRAFT_92568 [Meredithblackwellia eburnea MCA 4105]